MKEILLTLLKMENFPDSVAQKTVDEVFHDLEEDVSDTSEIDREEFVDLTSKNQILLDLLTATSDEERRHSLLEEVDTSSTLLAAAKSEKERRKSIAC